MSGTGYASKTGKVSIIVSSYDRSITLATFECGCVPGEEIQIETNLSDTKKE